MSNEKKITILYVEDEDGVRNMLSQFIARFCDQLYTAKNGKEGLDLYKEHKPDIVISDIRMPQMSGLEMAKAIKAIDPKQLIVIISAHSDSEFLLEAIALHIDGYLVKPVDLGLLEEEIQKLKNILMNQYASQKLLESEQKFSNLAESSEIGIFIYQNDRYIFTNKALRKITGYSEEDFANMYTWELLIPEQQERVRANMQRREKGEDFDESYQNVKLRCKDGSIKTARVNTTTITINNAYAGMGTLIDITDLVETSEQLRIYEQAIEQMNEMVRITALDDHIIFVNNAMSKNTGYAKEELIGANNRILKSGKHDEAFYKELWQTILSGNIYHNVFINKKKSGELYYEDQTITPITDPQTQQIKYFVSTSRDITQQVNMVKKLETLATIDSLTGIYNRYKINEAIDEEIQRAKRYSEPFALLMFDIDHFKKINDTYGHDVGDIVLQELSRLILDSIRESDKFGRWGGEEFMLLSPSTDKEHLLLFAEKLRKLIEDHNFTKVGKITVSIGVSIFHEGDNKTSFLKRVDDALYEAKAAGRNKVIFL